MLLIPEMPRVAGDPFCSTANGPGDVHGEDGAKDKRLHPKSCEAMAGKKKLALSTRHCFHHYCC